MDYAFLWLAFAALLAFVTQAMIGFGAVIIALTLGGIAYPIAGIQPAIVALSIPQTAWVVMTNRQHISWPVFLGQIVPFMGAGGVLGILIAGVLMGEAWFEILFGVLVISLASWELYKLTHRIDNQPISKPAFGVAAFIAGIIQGIYSSGGPALAYGAGRLGMSKAVFRATLSLVWLSFNIVLCIVWWFADRWTETALWQFLYLLPIIPVGLWLGGWLHHRVSDRTFAIALQSLLVFAGVVLIVG